MKKILLVVILTCFYAMVSAQSFYFGEVGKTIGTSYKLPAISLGYGFKQNVFTIEGGFKSNYSEYYTLLYSSLGLESKGKLLVGGNGGIGWTLNIEQLDRRYIPETGETKILHEGYEEDVICNVYGNLKLGYEVLEHFKVFKKETSLKVYGSYTYSFRSSFEVGIKLSSSK